MVDSVDLAAALGKLDLAERLTQIPANAEVRGAWFGLTSRELAAVDVGSYSLWRHTTASPRRLPFLLYPVREYVRELAVAGAILDPVAPAEGIRRIWRSSTRSYVQTPLGRSLARLLRPNPMRYLGWLARHRAHFCTYGEWQFVPSGDHAGVMDIHDEYIWIDSAHRGGAEGLLAACGVEGRVEVELTSRFTGRLHIEWRAPGP